MAIKPRRGDVWSVKGRAPRVVLVISGDLYNDMSDHPFVLAMEVVTDAEVRDAAPAVVELPVAERNPADTRRYAVIDTIGRVPKPLLTDRLGAVDISTLGAVDTWLFKILATN